jgi:hypothetical protein
VKRKIRIWICCDVLCQSRIDLIQRDIELRIDLEILEPQDSISLMSDEQIPFQILLYVIGFRVLAAIEFDNQPGCVRREIDYVRSNRDLPAKFDANEPAIAQGVPELSFDFGHLQTKSFCSGFLSRRDHAMWHLTSLIAAMPMRWSGTPHPAFGHLLPQGVKGQNARS